MASYVMAIDQGTTGTTVLILDKRLALRARVNQEFRQIFPRPGWVEHDLDDIWGSAVATVQRALREAGLRGRDIAAIGITNQRETTAAWDRRSGRALHHAIVWQDRRTTDTCARLKSEGHEQRVREKTGLVIDPYFSATKMRWLLETSARLRERAESGQARSGRSTLPRLAAHGRRGARHRRLEREPHAAHGPPRARGTAAARPVWCPRSAAGSSRPHTSTARPAA